MGDGHDGARLSVLPPLVVRGSDADVSLRAGEFGCLLGGEHGGGVVAWSV